MNLDPDPVVLRLDCDESKLFDHGLGVGQPFRELTADGPSDRDLEPFDLAFPT